MGLWQTEGFMGLAVLVDIAEVGFSIEPVVALRGEDEPTAVRRPRVIGVALLTVHNGKGVDGASLKIHQLEVSLRMPDGEGTVVGYRIEQIASVR